MIGYSAGRAFLAGVIGGAAMTVLVFLARLSGITNMNLALMMGSQITGSLGASAWFLGLAVHLVVSGVLGLLYGVAFRFLGRATWLAGLLIAVPHVLIAGAMMMGMPGMHPMIPDVFPAPGFLLLNMGAVTSIVFVLGHLVFGALVGAIYRPTQVQTQV